MIILKIEKEINQYKNRFIIKMKANDGENIIVNINKIESDIDIPVEMLTPKFQNWYIKKW